MMDEEIQERLHLATIQNLPNTKQKYQLLHYKVLFHNEKSEQKLSAMFPKILFKI
jgi:hypothetical protein